MARHGRRVVALMAALALAAVSATSASAAGKLNLKLNGSVASPGSGAFDGVFVHVGPQICSILSNKGGKLLTNGKAKDVLSFGAPQYQECEEETLYSLSGATATSVKVASSGAAQAKFAPKLAIHEPAPASTNTASSRSYSPRGSALRMARRSRESSTRKPATPAALLRRAPTSNWLYTGKYRLKMGRSTNWKCCRSALGGAPTIGAPPTSRGPAEPRRDRSSARTSSSAAAT
jgi:hypothetical protein